MTRLHSGVVVALSPHNKKETGFQNFYVESACSLCVCVGFLWILWLPPTEQRHALKVWLVGDSKLPSGVNVSECLCVSVCQPCDRLTTCP